MRTFHIGGAAQIADQSFIESSFDGTVRMRNRNVARNSDGELICLARNMAVVIVGQDGAERSVHRLQYGARLKVDEGDAIKRGQRIAEWDPYTRPIVTEVDGTIAFEDGHTRTLQPGDHLLIPAHCRHRVAWTDSASETLWLALHLPPG